jgi:drug/metabolite transporter (DMT)-like permease
LLAAVVVAPFAAPMALSAEGWGWLAMNGLLVAPAATAMLMVAPRYVAAAVVAMFFLLETVLTPIWMWGIFGEVPSPFALTGGAVVIIALTAHSVWRMSVSNRVRRSAKPQQMRP